MAIKLKITDGPSLCFQVSSITLNAGAGTGNFPALDKLDEKPTVIATDLALVGDSEDSFANKKSTWQQIIDSVLAVFLKISAIQSTLAALLITALNYQAQKTSLTPADAATATVNVATNYDYTITPTGSSFTLALSNIPATGTAWSVTIYAIDWDGVTVTLPSDSVTSGGSGLSFTSGGGNDRLVIRGNAGPSGEKEFYSLPGDMQ